MKNASKINFFLMSGQDYLFIYTIICNNTTTEPSRNFIRIIPLRLAFAAAFGQFRGYLLGTKFLHRTSHLCGLLGWNISNIWWLACLQQFHFFIEQRPGHKHINAKTAACQTTGTWRCLPQTAAGHWLKYVTRIVRRDNIILVPASTAAPRLHCCTSTPRDELDIGQSGHDNRLLEPNTGREPHIQTYWREKLQ